MQRPKDSAGFIALIAVTMLAMGAIAFAISVMSGAQSYAQSVTRREARIQARLYAASCLDSVTLMLAKDFFLNGVVSLAEFSCTATIANPYALGAVSIVSTVDYLGARASVNRTLVIAADSISF